jgi:hypothetical protein
MPRVGALYDPTTWDAADTAEQRRFTSSPDVRHDASDADLALGVVVIVAFIEAEVFWPTWSTWGAKCNAVECRPGLPLVVHVGTSDRQAQRNPTSVGQNVAFCAAFPSVGGIRTRLGPPFGAFTEALSSEHQSSPAPRSEWYSVSKCSQSFRKTPYSVHSPNRRWQVEPEPNSSGIAFQGHPVRRRYTMPASTTRSATGGRPPVGRSGHTGRHGRTRSQSSSGTSVLVNFAVGLMPSKDHERSHGSRGFGIRS